MVYADHHPCHPFLQADVDLFQCHLRILHITTKPDYQCQLHVPHLDRHTKKQTQYAQILQVIHSHTEDQSLHSLHIQTTK